MIKRRKKKIKIESKRYKRTFKIVKRNKRNKKKK